MIVTAFEILEAASGQDYLLEVEVVSMREVVLVTLVIHS